MEGGQTRTCSVHLPFPIRTIFVIGGFSITRNLPGIDQSGPRMSHYGGPESGATEFQSESQSLAAILLRFSRTVPISCHIIIFIKMAHYISNQMWFNFYAIYGTFHLNKSTNQKNKSLPQCQVSALGFGNTFPCLSIILTRKVSKRKLAGLWSES